MQFNIWKAHRASSNGLKDNQAHYLFLVVYMYITELVRKNLSKITDLHMKKTRSNDDDGRNTPLNISA